MNRLILHIIAGIISLWIAVEFIAGVRIIIIPGISSFFGFQFTAWWQILILIGSILGLINFFLRPILNVITLPLRILTLGLFGLVINMAIIWIIDVLFPELTIAGFIPLFWVAVLFWLTSIFLGVYKKA